MTPPILDWAAAEAAGPTVAGGKGWQLGRLDRFGIPVPPGFVIAAIDSGEERSGEPLPPALVASLDQALQARGWSDQPLVVRSSAPMEDSTRASYAGIHRSCLNVRGLAAVVRAVADVRDSLWTPQARAYRERFEVDAGEVAMAVVVMPLLPAVAAGIAFTCDPVSGRDDQLLVHAHWGLGESLVGGQAEGDEYRLQKNYRDDSLQLIAQHRGSKLRVTVAAAGGGTELRDTPDSQAAQPVLTSAQALALGAIACDAAGALDFTGIAYDLEWVWDGVRFWIVQARPVTAGARRTYPELVSQPTWWSRGNTREILPQPLSPVDWRLSRTMANRMLTRGYELSGYATLPGIQRAALFHGRVYLQTSVMQWEGYDALGVPPKAMNQLLGGQQPEIVVPPATAARRRAWGMRLLRYLHRAGRQRKHAEAALREARQTAAAWLTQDLPADNAALAQTLRQQFYAVHGVDDLYFLQGSAGGTLFNLVQMVDKYCPGEGHAMTAALMAGGEPSVTATQGYDLTALARVAQDDSQVLAWLRRPDRVAGDWRGQLPAGPFRLAFEEFLARYGHRGVYETYLRNPTWREAPGYLLDSVLNLIGSDPDALRERQRLGAVAAWRRLRSDVPFWARPIIGKLVKLARADCNNREAARSALVAYLEVLRRGVLELGRRFARQQDAFDRPDDIFNLLEPEVLALAEGRLPAAVAARRAAHRGAQLAAWADEVEPEVVAEHGELSTTVALDPAGVNGEGGGVLWRGTAVGGGRAQGRVRIARTPADGLDMAAGDVLVAAATDPAWTPLFLKAGALVMQTGGYLSHGAIVAREFGIPAVVNLPGILDRLQDGDRVAVDGGEGIVRRLPAE